MSAEAAPLSFDAVARLFWQSRCATCRHFVCQGACPVAFGFCKRDSHSVTELDGCRDHQA